jgi:hypothetical protein
MGGLALAAPAKPAVDTPAFSFLKQVGDTLKASQQSAQTTNSSGADSFADSLPAFWISAVYLSPAESGQQTTLSQGWTWFPTVTRDNSGNLLLTNTSAEWPVAANESRWDSGYPKQDVFLQEKNLPVRSCAAAVWPTGATAEQWRNYACSSHGVRYFVRLFSTFIPSCMSLCSVKYLHNVSHTGHSDLAGRMSVVKNTYVCCGCPCVEDFSSTSLQQSVQ